jgi:hypothetical protein
MEIESNGKKRTITKASENEFIISGHAIYLKWPLKEGESKVEFHYGPVLEVGKDFYGLGAIKKLEQVQTNDPTTKSIKVSISPS